jgi:acylphosphatase
MKKIRSVKGTVSGRVQGVGFRYHVMRNAQREQLVGYVRNLPDSRVEFRLQGEAEAVARVIEKIRLGPPHARVGDLIAEDIEQSLLYEFVIR